MPRMQSAGLTREVRTGVPRPVSSASRTCEDISKSVPRGGAAMTNPFAELTPRTFNLKSVPGLSDDARKAVNAAFDAMSAWRIDAAKNIEKYDKEVIEKIAAAAQALGWPKQIVDTARTQMQNITKSQIETMDHM